MHFGSLSSYKNLGKLFPESGSGLKHRKGDFFPDAVSDFGFDGQFHGFVEGDVEGGIKARPGSVKGNLDIGIDLRCDESFSVPEDVPPCVLAFFKTVDTGKDDDMNGGRKGLDNQSLNRTRQQGHFCFGVEFT